MDELVQYIPGDLVYFEGKIAKVEFNNPKYDSICIRVVVENGEEGCIWNAFEKEISPIPLTSEILEDNGWKKMKQFLLKHNFIIKRNLEVKQYLL